MKPPSCPGEFDRSLYAVPPRKRFKILEKQREEQEKTQLQIKPPGPSGSIAANSPAPPKSNRDRKPATHLKLKLLEEAEEEDKENKRLASNVANPLLELAAKKSGITSRVLAPCKESTEAPPEAGQGEEEDDGVSCDVCRSGDADPSDPIVFCDGCDVAVHSKCYGYPLSLVVPDGDWFCARCREDGASQNSCCLCPSTVGAMKRTTDGRWAHISCSIFVPEVFFGCGEGREPVDCSRVPGKRRDMVCSVCKGTSGACVQCTETGCEKTFHVACGFDREFLFEYLHTGKSAVVVAFCEKHTAAWEQVYACYYSVIAS